MPNWKLYTGYCCKHCKKGFIILKSIGKWNQITYLPINFNPGDNIPEFFDKEKHRSHLLDCPELAKQWEQIQKDINNSIDREQKFQDKLFMR